MTSFIERPCDFCGHAELEFIYTPIRTARGMKVHVCNKCGLLESISTCDYESRPPGSMSADADRSSYRYTKDIVAARYEEIFDSHITFEKVGNVLDIGSNRGAFIRWLEANYPARKIVAIEPHPEIIDSYIDLDNVEVQNCRFEDANLPASEFDFAFCVHTLEHAKSARQMLTGIRKALNPGGIFFLAVPNIIFYPDIIEEIFIDPHTFHFSFDLLQKFVERIGFTVEYAGSPVEPDIIFVLKKVDVTEKDLNLLGLLPGKKIKSSVEEYALNITRNRAAMKRAVSTLQDLSQDKKVVVWGGGRIFDALVQFGGLRPENTYLVIDKYLSSYLDEVHGCALKRPDVLNEEDTLDMIVYIASRDYADEIQAEAESYGVSEFIRFGQS